MSLDGPHNSWITPSMPTKGVVLLTHGLNGNPASLDVLGRALSLHGFEVFRPSFSGHRGNNQEFLAVNAQEWEADARYFHAKALARATALGVPLHHCAYSMSALIFMALADLRFSRRAYFAPALAMKFWYPFAIGIAQLFPWVQYRSRIPAGYFANRRSGFRSATALDQFHRRWAGVADETPTLIWADPKDELISARGLQALASQRPAWAYHEVSTKGCTMPVRYHHLIIDEAALGKLEWERVVRDTAAFLLNRTETGYSSSL